MTAASLAGSAPVGVPTWPAGLRDDLPLPFALWRVLHHVDGVRTAAEVAALARMSPADVGTALAQAEAWVRRAAQRSQPVTDEVLEAVTACVIAAVGPMGEFVVDDVLDELGEERPTLSTLLSALAGQLGEAQVPVFVRHLRARDLA
ncbi:hypothetical protein [Deinococcus murrayi]|uniref:hypothetical protein n=1 Tax=Deinococcus murrayi TaxID=68910 RepID=UPI000AB488DA|nr:hypothetical protein [Deinococcus murrayi]